MAKNKKHKNDKFYTKNNIAIELINLIDLSNYDCVIEPSAGNGSFSKNINHKKGVYITPFFHMRKCVKNADFLTVLLYPLFLIKTMICLENL